VSTITITRTAYAKIADEALEQFTAQCRSVHGMEVFHAAEQPARDTAGVLVPGDIKHGITRANGAGHVWAAVPLTAPTGTTAVVVVTGVAA
jgi:hypothetical protein